MQRSVRKTASGFYLLVSVITAFIIIFAAHENNTHAVAASGEVETAAAPTE